MLAIVQWKKKLAISADKTFWEELADLPSLISLIQPHY